MNYIGIDLHKNSSQVCILTEDGELIERRIKTDRESFDKLFGERPPTRILVEASTESEWAARHLEGLGHEVIVADPNFAPMYATRDRRIKTDKRDARALCEACRPGAYRPAHRTSDRQRDVRAHLAVRESMIRTRTKYISLISALARREGCRIKAGPSPSFARRVEEAGLPAHTLAQIEPLLVMLKALNEQIKAADKRIEEIAGADASGAEAVQRARRRAGGGDHVRGYARRGVALPRGQARPLLPGAGATRIQFGRKTAPRPDQ
jgi:transposase